MNAVRIALVAIAAALTGALGWMTDWGRDIVDTESTEAAKIVAKVDATSVLPDFKLGAESNAYAQIADRPLLNPTRKPAPTQAVVAVAPEPPKPQIRRGLYQLVGVADYGNVKVAQVRELATRKVASVRVGDALQELTVRKVTSDSITLSFAAEDDVVSMVKYTPSGQVPAPSPMSSVSPPAMPLPGVPQPIAAAAAPIPTVATSAGLPQSVVSAAQSAPIVATDGTAQPPRRSISMRERLGVGRDSRQAPTTASTTQ